MLWVDSGYFNKAAIFNAIYPFCASTWRLTSWSIVRFDRLTCLLTRHRYVTFACDVMMFGACYKVSDICLAINFHNAEVGDRNVSGELCRLQNRRLIQNFIAPPYKVLLKIDFLTITLSFAVLSRTLSKPHLYFNCCFILKPKNKSQLGVKTVNH